MSVTVLPNPNISSWTWFFDTEDEAHLFLAGQKEELAEHPDFDYVDSDVSYDWTAGSWALRLEYVDHRPVPDPPLAA